MPVPPERAQIERVPKGEDQKFAAPGQETVVPAGVLAFDGRVWARLAEVKQVTTIPRVHVNQARCLLGVVRKRRNVQARPQPTKPPAPEIDTELADDPSRWIQMVHGLAVLVEQVDVPAVPKRNRRGGSNTPRYRDRTQVNAR